MASFGGEHQISGNSQTAEAIKNNESSREGSVDRKACKDRDEKLKLARDRQNEERQRKIEELKAQAEAAQRYREQKEEERRRRIDEIRNRDIEKRQQVEERKKAIIEAEKERREYILRKNQERESRLESKKKERNSIGFAFGSSTPRLLEPVDFVLVSPSTFWGNRRSTSISNVAGASLSRRSSERELIDCAAKKRATSAGGTNRHDDHHRKSSSMYEVFNWGNANDEPSKRFPLSIIGSEINVDDPPTSVIPHKFSVLNANSTHLTATTKHNYSKEDKIDSSQMMFRSVARRKTDLMPTIPSPRDGHYGSRSSLSNTPRTPGRAYSVNRLDQLAQPIRRNGEHIHAVLERERRQQMEILCDTVHLSGGQSSSHPTRAGGGYPMSRSMTHLAGGRKYNLGGGISSSFRPIEKENKEFCKSMTQLTTSWSTPTRSNNVLQTAATKKYLQSSYASSSPKRRQNFTNASCYGPNSFLFMSSLKTGSRSGNVTPGGSINTSRPGSAMSTSTNLSVSGHVPRRSVASARKARPASIAGTGVSLEDIKMKKDKTPVKSSSPLSAQLTPKRTSNLMSTSLIVSSRLSSAEKKTPYKKEPHTPKSGSKPLSKTGSFDRLNKSNKENKPKDSSVTSMNKSTTLIALTPSEPTDVVSEQEPTASTKSKDEKNAFNTVQIDESNSTSIGLVLDKVSVPAVDEKIDQGNEKNLDAELKKDISVSKENAGIQDLDQSDLMSTSLISKSKINTEEEAKAALAERRRLAREEAERQAELERQRLESEHLAEIRRQEEEAERQRQFEEEAVRLAAEQRKTEEERLRLAIEETQQREKEERLRREEEEKQRIDREEAEKRAKEEAEKQRLEVAERLKREEKEREERRKRVEAIMSRTRKVRNTTNQTSTPSKEDNENVNKAVADEQNEQLQQTLNSAQNKLSICESSLENSSTEIPAPPPAAVLVTCEKNTSQAMYEQSVVDKEVSLMKNFSTVNEKAKNVQEQQKQPAPQNVETFNGKHNLLNSADDGILPPNKSETNLTLQNGNGHIENIANQHDMHTLENTEPPAASKLIDHSKQALDLNTLNFNNNSLLSTPNALVTANNHEHRDIPLV